MKVGIVTIHRANNYGAVLQAFATQQVYKRFAHAKIVDYRNQYISRTTKLIRFGGGARGLLRAGKDMLRISPRFSSLKKFSAFFERHLDLVPMPQHVQDYPSLESKFDVFVTGSDQVWNPEIVSSNGVFDPVYFLDFVRRKKKIAYAPSIGGKAFSEKELDELKKFLNGYVHLSSREETTAKQLSEWTGKNVRNVLDPTLLLTAAEWTQELNLQPEAGQGYILVYTLSVTGVTLAAIEKARKELGLPVVALEKNPFLRYKADKHIKDAGPWDFVNAFAGAKYVITNSFHGTAFAVNFGIPFTAVLPLHGANRLINLLNLVGLNARGVTSERQLTELPVDFPSEPVQERLAVKRQESIDYIERSLVD